MKAGDASSKRACILAATVAALVVVAWSLTYLAGGTRTPLPHAFYIPIVLSAIMLGLRPGVGTAIVAGIACGPLMPLDVAEGIPQPVSGWLIRLGFFVTIAGVVGLGRSRLIELSQARQRFLSVVSHELRTPLAAVVGFASILTNRADELTEAEAKEFASFILEEATELANVVDHYVLESRLRDSGLFIDPHPTDLRKVIDVVLDGLPIHVREQRVQVTGDDVVCLADPLRLRQMLRSILNHALAYTRDTIDIAILADKSYAHVKIDDGQSAPTRATLNPLTALSNMRQAATATVAAPLGIGLAVSRELARQMGGDLRYEVNAGTSYHLRLPLDSTPST